MSNQVVIGPGTPPPADSDSRALSAVVRQSIQDFIEVDVRYIGTLGASLHVVFNIKLSKRGKEHAG